MNSAPEKAAPIPAEDRLWWFLFVLNACGNHGAAANDYGGEWVAAFCNDEEPTDTFNRACDLKLAICTHNSMDETSRIWITEAGKRFLTGRASQEERIREDERSGSTTDEIDEALVRPFANDFAGMTDEQIEDEERRAQEAIEEHEPWLEACAARRRIAARLRGTAS